MWIWLNTMLTQWGLMAVVRYWTVFSSVQAIRRQANTRTNIEINVKFKSLEKNIWYMIYDLMQNCYVNSWGMWRHRPGSTLAQVIACFMTAPKHCLNQCWRTINYVLCHSHESNLMGNAREINLQNELEYCTLVTTATSHREQLVKWSR